MLTSSDAVARLQGSMCSLFINDLDAGAGRMGSMTQYTVNNQMVNATLMNIADNPTNVQLPGVYKNDPIHRVPIIATGTHPCGHSGSIIEIAHHKSLGMLCGLCRCPCVACSAPAARWVMRQCCRQSGSMTACMYSYCLTPLRPRAMHAACYSCNASVLHAAHDLVCCNDSTHA